MRSVDPANLDTMYDELHHLVAEIEARRGVRFELGEEMRSGGLGMGRGVNHFGVVVGAFDHERKAELDGGFAQPCAE